MIYLCFNLSANTLPDRAFERHDRLDADAGLALTA
jgi:hypothetical protein